MQTKQENELQIKNNIGTAGYARTVGEDGKSYRTGISDLVSGAIGDDIEQLENDVESLQTAVETNTGDITDLKEDVESLESEVSTLTDAVTLSTYNNDKVPYLFRPSGGGKYIGGIEKDTIVGGTVAWNQLVGTSNIAKQNCTYILENGIYTITPTRYDSNAVGIYANAILNNAHTYVSIADVYADMSGNLTVNIGRDIVADRRTLEPNKWVRFESCYTNDSTTRAANVYARLSDSVISVGTFKVKNFTTFDITQMFGSAIANYIYSLEQATAGSGVAKLKSWGFFTEDYYAYDSGSLKSVEGLEAHITRDADENIIGNYPLDSDLTLRGIPKLDSSNNLYYDGDIYENDGTVTRRYAQGQMTYSYLSGLTEDTYIGYQNVNGLGNCIWVRNWNYQDAATRRAGGIGAICNAFPVDMHNSTVFGSQNRTYFVVGSITTVSAFLSAVQSLESAGSGLFIAYELETSTTETADPYQNPQIVDKNGTEEYVTTGIVPVGHDTEYYLDADSVLTPPSTAGTYSLKVTVASDGSKSYSWVSD